MQNTRDMWSYRTPLSHTAEADLEGFDVQARDGSIGHVDEATNDVNRQSVVVDTGPWIFGRKVVLPAATIETIDLDKQAVVVSLTKDQIKDSPEYDPDRYDDEYRNRLAKYYEQQTY
jgi:predicted RNA-binding protein with PIN domain